MYLGAHLHLLLNLDDGSKELRESNKSDLGLYSTPNPISITCCTRKLLPRDSCTYTPAVPGGLIASFAFHHYTKESKSEPVRKRVREEIESEITPI